LARNAPKQILTRWEKEFGHIKESGFSPKDQARGNERSVDYLPLASCSGSKTGKNRAEELALNSFSEGVENV